MTKGPKGTKESFVNDCKKTSTGFEYDDKLSFDENMLRYRSYLTDFEKKNFDTTRQSKYWWTFATCILYGSLALILLLFGSLTEYGNYLLFNELYIFIITYIIGTILIIIILIYKVYSFDFPDTNKKVGSDSLYCPDYWDSSIINPNKDEDKYNKMVGNEYKRYFGKKSSNGDFNLECELKEDSGIYNSNSLLTNTDLQPKYGYKQASGNNSKLYVELLPGEPGNTGLSVNNGDYEEFRKIAASMAGYTYDINSKTLERNNDNAVKNSQGQGQFFDAGNANGPIPLVCDKVYPLYMAKKDFEYSNSKGLTNYNKFRCAYSKACGIPWTEVGCS